MNEVLIMISVVLMSPFLLLFSIAFIFVVAYMWAKLIDLIGSVLFGIGGFIKCVLIWCWNEYQLHKACEDVVDVE